MSRIPLLLYFLIVPVIFVGCIQQSGGISADVSTHTPFTNSGDATVTGILFTSTNQIPEQEFTPEPTDTPNIEPTIENPEITLTSTIEPQPAVSETSNPEETITSFSTLPPIPSSTPTASIPIAPIQIFSPGDGSIVSSPIPLEAIVSSYNGVLLRIELLGEKDRLLTRIIKKPNQLPWPVAPVSMDILFQIRQLREKGRLVVSVDDHFGRTIDTNSVALFIAKEGGDQIYPSSQVQRRIVIKTPEQDETVDGSTLLVEGLVAHDLSNELKLKIVAENGKVLGQRLTSGAGDVDSEGYMVFSGEVPFSINKETPARLMVFVDSQTGSQIYYLASVEIFLKP